MDLILAYVPMDLILAYVQVNLILAYVPMDLVLVVTLRQSPRDSQKGLSQQKLV